MRNLRNLFHVRWKWFNIVVFMILFVLSSQARGKDVIRVAIQSEGKTLDPHQASDAASMRLIENMSCGLLRYGSSYGTVENDLALDFDISEDGQQYTFFLRKNAFFHTGKAVTSEAVKASIERIQRLKVRASHFALVEEIITPDPHRIIFKLKSPFSPFLLFLANPMNAILDVSAIRQSETQNIAELGCGPYQFKTWQRHHQLQLHKFPKYYKPMIPSTPKLEIRPIPDESSRSIALRTGEVDLIFDVPLKDLRKISTDQDVIIDRVSGTFWEYLGFQTKRPPLNQIMVRQALSLAIDRDQLNRIVKFNLAEPLYAGPIPETHWAGSTETPYAGRKLAQAKQLLAQAGYPKGFSLTLLVGSDFSYQVDAAIVIKQQLKDLGVHVKIKSEESSMFFHHLNHGSFDMAIAGWIGFVDPDEWFYEIFHSQGKWNQQKYQNTLLDQLVEEGRRVADQKGRSKIYRQVQKILIDEAPMAYLYLNQQIVAYRRDLKNFKVHPTGTSLGLQKGHF